MADHTQSTLAALGNKSFPLFRLAADERELLWAGREPRVCELYQSRGAAAAA